MCTFNKNMWSFSFTIEVFNAIKLKYNTVSDLWIYTTLERNIYFWLIFIFAYQKSLKRTLKPSFWVQITFWIWVLVLRIHKGYHVVKIWCEKFASKISDFLIGFVVAEDRILSSFELAPKHKSIWKIGLRHQECTKNVFWRSYKIQGPLYLTHPIKCILVATILCSGWNITCNTKTLQLFY